MLDHGRLSYASRLRVTGLLAAYSPILLGTDCHYSWNFSNIRLWFMVVEGPDARLRLNAVTRQSTAG